MNQSKRIHLLITLGAILMYLPFLGSFHLFDWDEINFAEAAREMLITKQYFSVQIAFEPFWEKPPLFIWLQALFMQLFGVSEFAARLPSALTGIITLNIIYHIGRKTVSHFAGIFWVLAYAGSLAPTLYFKTGIIDPVFNLFIFLSVYQFFLAESSMREVANPRIHMLLTGVFAGLAVLTKGPVALLLIGATALIRIIQAPKYAWPGMLNTIIAIFSSILIGFSWIGIETAGNGWWFLKEFFEYQLVLAGGQIEWHNQPWYYHIVVLLVLCFPAAIFALPHLFKSNSEGLEKTFSAYMRILFWVVLIVFSLVTTKIIHYSSMCWLPLTWFAGISLYRKHTNRGNIPRWIMIPVFVIGILIASAFIVGPYIFAHPQLIAQLGIMIKDDFAMKILFSKADWTGLEMAPGIFYFLLIFIIGLLWMKRKQQASMLFAGTGFFALTAYFIVIPKVENQLQGDTFREMKSLAEKDVFLESRGYKSYAIYFYGACKPEIASGPWKTEAKKFTGVPNPINKSREYWFAERPVNKPVYIVTKSTFNADTSFLKSFKKSKETGAYIFWLKQP